MQLSIKTKLLVISAIMLSLACSSAYINKHSIDQLISSGENILTINTALRNHMEGDMMHDAIRADMISTLYALQTNDAATLQDVGNDLKEHTEHFEEMVAENEKMSLPPEITQALSDVKTPLEAYIASARSMYETAKTDRAKAEAMYPAFKQAFSDLEGKMGAVSDIIEKTATEAQEASTRNSQSIVKLTLILSVITLLLIVSLPLATLQWLFKPLRAMMHSMQQLAQGNNLAEIPYIERNDEMGEMAQTVKIFRDNAIAKERMEREQQQAEANAAAERKELMKKLAMDFESSVQGIINNVSAAATQLQQTAEDMQMTISSVSSQSNTIASSSQQTTSNVQSISAAVEEMAASVREISSQIHQTSTLVSDTVDKTSEADQSAKVLSGAVGQISGILELIQNIAGQINLLALNASIESARAGEAGKGFAVVASEVKNLANQTSKATEEIAKQITNVQQASTSVMHVLQKIHQSISTVNHYSSGISAAVEEQSAATNEISANMHNAASGVQTISGNISTITHSTSTARNAAGEVLSAAQNLAQQSKVLKDQVQLFMMGLAA